MQDKRILLVGFGNEGHANLQYVATRGARTIGIADQASRITLTAEESQRVSRLHLGPAWLEALNDYDVLIRSPGVPLHVLTEALPHSPKCHITSGTNLFLERHADKTIGVTGTKGKSTTTSLIFNILRNAGIDACLGGNIGIAPISLLNTPAALYVLELSSYQLEDCSHSPHGAVFLNLYPEHLDHHRDFASYGAAKARISRFQHADNFLVIPETLPVFKDLTVGSPGSIITFGSCQGQAWIENNTYHYRSLGGAIRRLCAVDATRLKGPGNQHNILAALSVASQYPVTDEVLTDTLVRFSPLPHRLEEIGTVNGVTFINDSISTVPQATINALETFGSRVTTVILGGYDRGVPFDSLATYLASSSVQTLLLFSPSGIRIQDAVERAHSGQGKTIRIVRVESMGEAIDRAFELTPAGDICLLSPASPSFPLFKNFEERGERFREEVRARAS